jgi:hypothetical protein
VGRAPLELKRPELASASPTEAMTVAAMAPLIATAGAMRTATMAATTAASAMMTSVTIGANLFSAGQRSVLEPDALSVPAALDKAEDKEKMSDAGGVVRPKNRQLVPTTTCKPTPTSIEALTQLWHKAASRAASASFCRAEPWPDATAWDEGPFRTFRTGRQSRPAKACVGNCGLWTLAEGYYTR